MLVDLYRHEKCIECFKRSKEMQMEQAKEMGNPVGPQTFKAKRIR